jgi:multiple sugar transport system permease protein
MQRIPVKPVPALVREAASGPGAGRRGEEVAGAVMAAPAALLLLAFLITPFLLAFVMSFTNQRLVSPNPTSFVGVRNFAQLLTVRPFVMTPLTDPATGASLRDDTGALVYPVLRDITRRNPDYPQYDGLRELRSWQFGERRLYLLASDVVFMRAFGNTLLFVLVVAPTQATLALLLALMINQRLRGVNVFRTIYFMPVVISIVVVSLLWRFIYSPTGLLNSMLTGLSFGAFTPIDWLGNPNTALGAIMAMSIWQAVGFHMVIWLSGLQTIPGVLYEAASVEGANTLQKFQHVTWPGLRNTAVLILVVITMQAFALFAQIDVMTRGGPRDATQSIVFQAVQRGFERQDIAGGSAISVVLFLLVLSVSLLQRYLTRERAR